MGEAEYCQRVEIMQAGKLLAMDTTAALKYSVPGQVWEIRAEPLLAALEEVQQLNGVLRVSLSGDSLRLVAGDKLNRKKLQSWLTGRGIQVESVQPVQTDMEEAFLYLAGAS